jgi:transposase-like protein
MPAERTAMRQVREVLRLKFVGGVPTREIARRIGVAASTVRETIRRFQAAGLSWPLPEELSDLALEAKLFAAAGTKQGHRRQVEPDWASIQRELKRKHVTLALLSSAIQKVTATLASAIFIAAGSASSRSPCARPTWVVTSCSSIMPATRCR